MKPLPLNPRQKISHHIDALFGKGVSKALPIEKIQFEYSRKTGRIKNFSLQNRLIATLRTDGGLALTVFGAQELSRVKHFKQNCVIPAQEAFPFVSEGRSLFCKHVQWCGSNIRSGSDVAVLEKDSSKVRVIATGVALVDNSLMRGYQRGVAVRIREGIKTRKM
ncbi:MAG: queuine tRNA-ribosyltransferase [Thermoproteota archaeon]|nr:queuine tRNA-ribosyltransferase [Thermoproteota archaeon]